MAVAYRVARHHTGHPSHFVQQADLRLARCGDVVQPRVLDHLGHVAADGAARPQAEKPLMDRAHITQDPFPVYDGRGLERIRQEVGEDVAREVDGTNQFE